MKLSVCNHGSDYQNFLLLPSYSMGDVLVVLASILALVDHLLYFKDMTESRKRFLSVHPCNDSQIRSEWYCRLSSWREHQWDKS